MNRHQKYKNLDLSLLINEEIISNKNYYSAIVGILNIKFFQRLKKNNIKIKKTINLFENQAAGRGWNYGSRNYFPDIKIKYIKKDKLVPKRGTLSINKAKKLIGYKPKWDLDKGYRNYIDWYQKFIK